MPNKWIEFIKQFAGQNDISYKEALKNETAKMKYRKHLHSLLVFGKPIIEVSKTMNYIDNKGKEHEVDTLTKTGNLTKRNKKPAMNLIQNNLNKINVSKTLSKDSYARKVLEGVKHIKLNSNLEKPNLPK